MKKTDKAEEAMPLPAETAPIEAPAPTPSAPAVERLPQEGGSFIRLPDGTLVREEEA